MILADDESDHAALLHKLRTLILGEIDLRNATSKEALRVLSDECIKSDPEHRGISFVGHFRQMDEATRITLHLEGVSVKEALKHLFDYSVETNVVRVGYDHICESVIVRHFEVPNGLFLLGPSKPGDAQKKIYDVTPQLVARGLERTPVTSAIYEPEKKQLTVMATSSEQLNLVDEILNP